MRINLRNCKLKPDKMISKSLNQAVTELNIEEVEIRAKFKTLGNNNLNFPGNS